MIKARLVKGDGMGTGRPWLRSVVRNAQRGLVEAGHPVTADGKFGGGTRKALRAFQTAAGIESTGVVDSTTWTSLEPFGANGREKLDAKEGASLEQFRGDLDWVHLQEGHEGRPYWPKGASGVTLDPGVDLGHASPDTIEALYQPLLTRQQMKLLREVFGLKGRDARDALSQMPQLKAIRISREQGFEVMPFAAKPYWDGIRKRFRAVQRKDTPPSVQTVLLSLAYNRGIFNKALKPLGALLQNRDWTRIAAVVGRMQQSHELEGIRRRRRDEASVIRAEIELMADG